MSVLLNNGGGPFGGYIHTPGVVFSDVRRPSQTGIFFHADIMTRLLSAVETPEPEREKKRELERAREGKDG